MSDVNVHVECWEQVSARVSEAWGRAARGEAVTPERHLSFAAWEGLSSVLSGKRLELLRHLHRHPEVSIAALARAVDRDYRRVHEDVEMLVGAGLIDRRPEGLRADYDSIQTTIAL